MKLLFSCDDGRVLGAQAVGEEGVEKRIDVIAMAIQKGATIYDLEEAELCYAPQFGTAKDPVNFAGMIAANVLQGDVSLTCWEQVARHASAAARRARAFRIHSGPRGRSTEHPSAAIASPSWRTT